MQVKRTPEAKGRAVWRPLSRGYVQAVRAVAKKETAKEPPSRTVWDSARRVRW
jgi:hypothetical protein